MGLDARRIARRVEDWFFASVPIDPMVLARMLLGFALFSSYLWRLPDIELLYGPEALGGRGWLHDLRPHSAFVTGVVGWLDSTIPFSRFFAWALYLALLAGSL